MAEYRIARVRTDDGRIARVRVPANATKEQILAQARRVVPTKPKETSFWQGVAEGVMPAAYNAAKVVNRVNPIMSIVNTVTGGGLDQAANKGQSQTTERLGRTGYQGSTLGRITGAVAGSLPTMAIPGAGWLPTLAQGAASGAMLSKDILNPREAIPDALMGAATAGVVKGGMDYVVAPTLRAAANSAPGRAITSAVRAPQLSLPAKIKPTRMPTLGDDATERAARFSRVGVQNPTTGMVTRNPTAWTRERNLQQLDEGLPIREAILGVQDDLYNAGRNMTQGAPGAEATGRTAKELVEKRGKRLGEEVSTLYTRARDEFGDVPVSSLDNLWTTMADPSWRNNVKFGGMNSQITGMLKDFGVIDDAGANIPGASLNLSQANELRKFIGNLGDGMDPTIRAARKKLVGSLDDDVLDNVGNDAFAQARNAARSRFKEFESGLTSKMASDGMFDEALPRRIVGQGTSHQQVRDLFETLGAEGDAGAQAINQIRQQAVKDLIDNSRVMMNDGATTTINGKTLFNKFADNRDRYKVILGDDMFAQVEDYVAAARDATVQPAMSSVNNSGTAAMLLNNAQRETPDMVGDIFAAPKRAELGIVARNAPAIGGGIGATLGSMTPTPWIGAGGGAAVGAAAGRSLQELAEKRAQQQLSDITRRQISMAVDPMAAASALDEYSITLARQAQEEAQRQAYRRTLGSLTAPVTAGLLSFR